ncbi:MAG: hypothetical protein HN675_10365, partial [Opitutae bacterium]|nr:hypothetical protein [Opitutae bacterium]
MRRQTIPVLATALLSMHVTGVVCAQVTNLAPTDISLDSAQIQENAEVNSVVGKFLIEDPDFARIQKISCGSHTLFLMDNGALWGMGQNSSGQLGDGGNENHSTPYRIFESGVKDIAAGLNHTLVVKSDGSLWAFGSNQDGQLGDGTFESNNEPKMILEGEVDKVWAGGYHSLIIKNDNSLWGFGGNNKGQLGNGATQDINTPIHIADDIVTVSAMGWHSIYINANGELWGMGSNGDGQLGDGTTEDRHTPIKIINQGVELIACGGSHTLFTQNGGELWSMGKNNGGQLGDGTYDDKLEPVKIQDGDVTFIEARANNSIFVKKDGSLWAMGINNKGQVGDGTTEKRNQPTLVVEKNVVQAEAGVNHSLYLKEDGSMWGMGGNSSGELGDGTTTNRPTPVQLYTLTTSFELISGDGDDNNDRFHIHGDQLLSEAIFDFESEKNFSIRVKGTDIGGSSIEKKLQINVTDGPDSPTGILLNESNVDENLKKGTEIGTLAATDEDTGEKHTFKLVDLEEEPGTDTSITIAYDNALFSISGSTLKTSGTFDYESQSAYTILVEVEDKDDRTFQQEISIGINDANDAPTGATLTPNFVSENLPKGTEVGVFSATDPDADDTHTYKLQGGDDKSLFKITDNKLTTNAILDFETQSELEIIVRISDAKKDYIDILFNIEVTDINDAPIDITLDNNTTPENSPVGTTVGVLSTADPDSDTEGMPLAGDLVLWLPFHNGDITDLSATANATVLKDEPTAVPDRFGNADSALSFDGINDWIEANSVADDLTKGASFSYWMKSTSTTRQAIFAINKAVQSEGEENILVSFLEPITGADQASLRIRLNSGFQISQTPVSDNEWHHVLYCADENNGELYIDGILDLSVTHPVIFSPNHQVSIGMELDRGTDNNVTNAGNFHNGIIDDLRVYNRKLTGEDVHRLHELEKVATSMDYPVYSLVEGKDDDDNTLFSIAGDELKIASPLNYETEDEYSVRVKATDSGGISIEKAFTINLNNLPEAPVGITLDNETVAENLKKGTAVGELSAIDEDAGEKHTFKLVDDAGGTANDNALFAISGTTLKTNTPFDFEAASSYTVHIEVTDQDKLTYAQVIPVAITDDNDPPTSAGLSPGLVAENLPKGAEVGIFTVTDPDAGDTHTYKLQGGDDKSKFKILGDKLITNAILDHEAQPGLEVIVRVTDADKAYIDIDLTIDVIDANDAPTGLLIDNLSIAENNAPEGVVGIFTPVDPDGFIDGSEMDVIKSVKTFGGPSLDLISSVVSDDKGNLFLSGNFTGTIDIDGASLAGSGNQSQFVAGLDPAGGLTWSHAFTTENSSGMDHQRRSLAIDTGGNLLLANYFKGEIDIGGTSHASKGALDSIVARFTREGGLTWAESFGSTDDDWAATVATDSKDNVYVAGNSKRTFSIGNTSLPLKGSSSIFLVKLDSDGQPVWGKTIGSDGWEWPGGIATDPQDNVILAGFHRATIDIEGTTLPHMGETDILLAKYNSSGNLLWATGFGTEGEEWPKEVATDAGGNIYLTGRYSGAISIDGHTLDETEGTDVFLAKFSPQGDALWLRGFTAVGDDWGHSLAVDAFGNIILVGSVGTGLTIDGNILSSAGGTDILFARFAPDGTTLHATTIGGSQDEVGLSVTIAPNGDYIVGGGFSGELSIDGETHTSNGGSDALLVRIGGASHQVSLVAGKGDEDNNAFAIRSGKLVARNSFNFEDRDEYDIRVRLTDAAGTFIEQELGVTIDNAPDAPTGITLDNDTVAENLKKGSTVGNLGAIDPDAGEKHTYQLVERAGNSNGSPAEILFDNGTKQIVGTGFYHSSRSPPRDTPSGSSGTWVTENQYAVWYASWGNLWWVAEFYSDSACKATVISGSTEATIPTPAEITAEIALTGAHHGPWTGKLPVFIDNALFKLSGNRLTTDAVLDFEAKPSHTVHIEVVDRDGLTFAKELVVHVVDANDEPTGITLSNSEVPENLPKGTEIGTLSATDPDEGDTLAFKLQGGADKSLFKLSGNKLTTNVILDHEDQDSLEVTIRVTDNAGAYTDATFNIAVTDANDAPTDITLDNDTVTENEAAGTVVGKLALVDVDGGKDFSEPVITEGVGEKLWEFETGGHVSSSPAIGSDGTVYV